MKNQVKKKFFIIKFSLFSKITDKHKEKEKVHERSDRKKHEKSSKNIESNEKLDYLIKDKSKTPFAYMNSIRNNDDENADGY